MTRRCDVYGCRDRARYRWAVAEPSLDLPPVCGYIVLLLCGTHQAGPWPFRALQVRCYRGNIE